MIPLHLPASTGVDTDAWLSRHRFAASLRTTEDDHGWDASLHRQGWSSDGAFGRWEGSPVPTQTPWTPIRLADFVDALSEHDRIADPRFTGRFWETWEPIKSEDCFGRLAEGPGVFALRRVEPEVDGVLFVGVPTSARGQGHGHRTYSAVQQAASERALHLIDECAAANLAMVAVLRRAGMQETARWVSWRRPTLRPVR